MKKIPPLKTALASRITIAQLMQPEHANNLGNVHGGWIMDEAGALACMRHCRRRVVTVFIDQMEFHQPIRIGDLVTLTGEVTFTGRTSLEAEVKVTAEDPTTGDQVHTNTAYVVYVALDDDRRPTKVPPIEATTPEEQEKIAAGKKRQTERLARRK
jgi:acyl-CoA hydrolase